jgi:hypothetical protein
LYKRLVKALTEQPQVSTKGESWRHEKPEYLIFPIPLFSVFLIRRITAACAAFAVTIMRQVLENQPPYEYPTKPVTPHPTYQGET